MKKFVFAPYSLLLYFPTMTVSDDVPKPFNKVSYFQFKTSKCNTPKRIT